MSFKVLLSPILDNEQLTRGLGDPEARLLIEWLVERAEESQAAGLDENALRGEIARFCRRARALARFVWLWCYHGGRAAACQLAATEQFAWPLPSEEMDPYDLMTDILFWEAHPEALEEME